MKRTKTIDFSVYREGKKQLRQSPRSLVLVLNKVFFFFFITETIASQTLKAECSLTHTCVSAVTPGDTSELQKLF